MQLRLWLEKPGLFLAEDPIMAGSEMPAGVVFGSPALNSGVEAVTSRNEQLLLPQSNFSHQHLPHHFPPSETLKSR
jgi:hypothetical protein